jgi:hypothetical protein
LFVVVILTLPCEDCGKLHACQIKG